MVNSCQIKLSALKYGFCKKWLNTISLYYLLIAVFLTASLPTQSKELLCHFRNIKTFTQFEAYYVMSDMKWYDCIKLHHKGLGQVKTCFKMEKKIEKEMEKKEWKEKD